MSDVGSKSKYSLSNKDVRNSLKVGDIIFIKTEDEFRKEFGSHWASDVQNSWNRAGMDKFFGKELIIDEKMMRYIRNDNTSIYNADGYNFSTDMMKIQSNEGESEEMSEKESLYTANIIIVDKKQEILDKMISMVNTDQLAKVMAIGGSDNNYKSMPPKKMIKDYLERWALAKYEIFVMFGEQLRIEKNMDFEIDSREMEAIVEDLCMKFPQHALTLMHISANDYIKNEMDRYEVFEKYSHKFFKKGMKVTKFISSLIENDNLDLEISKALQNRMISGKIVVSIDPYDYLTMSTNMHKWNSCHNVAEGGYATGGFSYLCDDNTLIAYKDNGKSYDYNIYGFRFSGNSKSWRQCIHYDKKTSALIFARQYPNKSDVVAKEIRTMFEEVISAYTEKENVWLVTSNNMDGDFDDFCNLHYSDVTNGSDYKFARLKNLLKPEGISFKFGSKVKCVFCGTLIHEPKSRVACDCLERKELQKQEAAKALEIQEQRARAEELITVSARTQSVSEQIDEIISSHTLSDTFFADFASPLVPNRHIEQIQPLRRRITTELITDPIATVSERVEEETEEGVVLTNG